MTENYRLHDLVLEYLQLVMKMNDDRSLARLASSRQARYLRRLDVLKTFHSRGANVRTGGIYSLIALWNSVKKLDCTIDVKEHYLGSLKGVTDIGPWRNVGYLLVMLVRFHSLKSGALLCCGFLSLLDWQRFNLL